MTTSSRKWPASWNIARPTLYIARIASTPDKLPAEKREEVPVSKKQNESGEIIHSLAVLRKW
jgi:hypothetical protein